MQKGPGRVDRRDVKLPEGPLLLLLRPGAVAHHLAEDHPGMPGKTKIVGARTKALSPKRHNAALPSRNVQCTPAKSKRKASQVRLVADACGLLQLDDCQSTRRPGSRDIHRSRSAKPCRSIRAAVFSSLIRQCRVPSHCQLQFVFVFFLKKSRRTLGHQGRGLGQFGGLPRPTPDQDLLKDALPGWLVEEGLGTAAQLGPGCQPGDVRPSRGLHRSSKEWKIREALSKEHGPPTRFAAGRALETRTGIVVEACSNEGKKTTSAPAGGSRPGPGGRRAAWRPAGRHPAAPWGRAACAPGYSFFKALGGGIYFFFPPAHATKAARTRGENASLSHHH